MAQLVGFTSYAGITRIRYRETPMKPASSELP